MILALLSMLTTSSFALSDFDAEIKKLEKNSQNIDEKIKNLGLWGERQNKAGNEESAVTRSPLFQVHSDLTQRMSEAGKRVYARTLTRLIVGSEISPAILECQDNQGVFSSLKFLGKATQSSTEGRVTIEINRIVFSSGSSKAIKALVLDEEGAFGLKAQVFSSKALMLAGSMASSFITGFASGQQTLTTTPFGFQQNVPTNKNAILQGVAQTAADQSRRLIEEATKEKPVLVVDPGTLLQVYFDEEVRF